jgi:hypothetical protein
MRDFKMYLEKNWLALTPHLGKTMIYLVKFYAMFRL